MEVICYELGSEFKVLPWRLEEEGSFDIMKYWEIHQIKIAERNKKDGGGSGSSGSAPTKRQGVSSDQIHAAAKTGKKLG